MQPRKHADNAARQAAYRKRNGASPLDRGRDELAARLRKLVATELESLGYHRHKGQWRKRRDA